MSHASEIVAGTKCLDKSIEEFALWLCHETFPKPTRSKKFPGTEVVSIMRQDLEKFHGIPLKHLIYPIEHIKPWLKPVTRHKSTEKTPKTVKVKQLVVKNNQCTININDIDFGPPDELLFVF